MAARKCTLRDAIYVAVEADKPTYVVTNFVTEKTWFPYHYLETLAEDYPNGKLYLVAMASDEQANQSRTNIALNQMAVMCGFQKANVTPTDRAAIDVLVELEEQIRYTIQKLALAGYSWLRTDAMRDGNGAPYSFIMLRQAHTFEAYFTAFFNHVIS